jgi:hypothetical protein
MKSHRRARYIERREEKKLHNEQETTERHSERGCMNQHLQNKEHRRYKEREQAHSISNTGSNDGQTVKSPSYIHMRKATASKYTIQERKTSPFYLIQ